MRIFEEAAFGRAGRAGTVFVINATVTRAHEQARLGKPAHGTAEVRTVNGENLKGLGIDTAHPTSTVRGFAVPRRDIGIAEGGEARLAGGILIERAESEPAGVAGFARARDRRKKVADDGHREKRAYDAIEKDTQLHEHGSARKIFGQGHGRSPAGFAGLG